MSGSDGAVARRGGRPVAASRPRRGRFGRSGLASVAVLTTLALGAGSFLLGTGTVNQALQLLDGGVWVSDGASGTATRVNVAAAQADLAYRVVPDGVEVVEVVNVDGDLVAIGSDGVARVVGAAEGPQQATELPLDGAQVYAGRDWVFLVDKAAGTVTARSLEQGRLGDPQPTTLDAPIGAVAVGPGDALHAVLKGKDQVAVVHPGHKIRSIALPHADSALLARRTAGVAAVDAGRGVVTDLPTGKTRSMPKLAGTVQAVSASDGWVVAVGGNRLVGVDLRDGRTTQVDLGVQAAAPPAGSGSSIVSVLGSNAYVVGNDGKARQVSLPQGRVLASIGIDGGRVKEAVTGAAGVVLNDPTGPGATVIGKNGKPKHVNKGGASGISLSSPVTGHKSSVTGPKSSPTTPLQGIQTPQPWPEPTPRPGCEMSQGGTVYVVGAPFDCYPSVESLDSQSSIVGGANSVDTFWSNHQGWVSMGAEVWKVASVSGRDPSTGREWSTGRNYSITPATRICLQVEYRLWNSQRVGQSSTWHGTTKCATTAAVVRPVTALAATLNASTSNGRLTVKLTWSMGAGDKDPDEFLVSGSGIESQSYSNGIRTLTVEAPPAGSSNQYCVASYYLHQDVGTQCQIVHNPYRPIIGFTAYSDGSVEHLSWSLGAGEIDPEDFTVWTEKRSPRSDGPDMYALLPAGDWNYCVHAYHSTIGDYGHQCLLVGDPPLALEPNPIP